MPVSALDLPNAYSGSHTVADGTGITTSDPPSSDSPQAQHWEKSMFRYTIFWIHLISGLISGIVIAIMSITGIAIAFENEILHWIDRNVAHEDIPANPQVKTIAELSQIVSEERPDFPFNYLIIPSEADAAYQYMIGFGNPLYVNPYTGELAGTKTTIAHEIIHELEVWHRFLGFHDEENWIIGRHINGATNVAFLFLCITGLYIWFPRDLKWRLFKNALFFKKTKGKARDFNWHHVFGIWSLPVLAVLAATAVVISYEWGHKIPFAIYGEKAPESRNFGMMAVEPAKVPTPDPEAKLLTLEEAIQSTKEQYPDWVSIGIRLPKPVTDREVLGPLNLDLTRPDYMPSRAWAPVEVDPYTGEILQITTFQDRSPGLRARVWTRFLHTGAGFGIWGKVVASLATAASLFLVYTGFALSYRRFFKRRFD